MIEDACDCLLCFYKDAPECKAAYLKGYIEASDEFLRWAESHNIEKGLISDSDDCIENFHRRVYESNLFYNGYLEALKEKGEI